MSTTKGIDHYLKGSLLDTHSIIPNNLRLDFQPFCQDCRWFDPAEIERIDIDSFDGRDDQTVYFLRCLHEKACRRRENERSDS